MQKILPPQTKDFLPVYLLLLGVMAFWGVNVVMIKYLTQYFTPSALAAVRLTAATLLLVPLVYRRYGWVKLPKREWFPILGVAFCCITFHQLALSWGLSVTSGTHGVLILALGPLFTTILAARFANEPYTFNKTASVILGLSGIILIVARHDGTGSAGFQGDMLIFLAMLLYVIGTLCVKKSTATIPPLVVTAYSHIIGSLGLLVIAAVTSPVWIATPFTGATALGVFLCSAWGATALGALGWNTGIQRIGASTASLFLSLSTLIGLISSAVFLDELLTWHHYLSLFLVLTGVGIGTGILQRSVKHWGLQQTKA